MKPKYINGKWYIEVETKEFGNILLLKDGLLPIPITFESENEVLDYIRQRS